MIWQKFAVLILVTASINAASLEDRSRSKGSNKLKKLQKKMKNLKKQMGNNFFHHPNTNYSRGP